MKFLSKLLLLFSSIFIQVDAHKSARSSMNSHAAKSIRNYEERKTIDVATHMQPGKAYAYERAGLKQAFSHSTGVDATDKGILPPEEPSGTFTLTDTIRIDATNNIIGSGSGSVVVNGGRIRITADQFTNFPQDTLIQEITTAGTDPTVTPVTIRGNTTLNGTLELDPNSRLRIEGNLTVNGTANNYITIGFGATLEVTGTITFDGMQLYNVGSSGTITTDNTGDIIMQNNRSTGADAVRVDDITSAGSLFFVDNEGVNDSGVFITGAAQAAHSTLFSNNKGNIYGVYNDLTGSITSRADNITFALNCGDTSDVQNDGTITSSAGQVESFGNVITGTATTPAVTTLTAGSMSLSSQISIDGSQNLTFTSGTTVGNVVPTVGIETPGSITNFPATEHVYTAASSNCVTDRVLITGSVILTGKLTLEASSYLEVDGNLTVTGNIADYIDIKAGATLQVNGDLRFDGANQYNILHAGTITSTISDAEFVFISNASSTGDAIFVNSAGTITNTNGTMLFAGNSGEASSRAVNVTNVAAGALTAQAIFDCSNTPSVDFGTPSPVETTVTCAADGTILSITSTGTLTINDVLTINNNDVSVTSAGNVSVSTSSVDISTSGTIITDLSSVSNLTTNVLSPSNRVVISAGTVNLTGRLVLSGNTTLEIVGDLNVVGNVADYVDIELGSHLIVNGDIVLNGADAHNVKNLGFIQTTGMNSMITIEENENASGIAVENYRLTSTGNILIQDNNGSTIGFRNTDLVDSAANVTFINNCGDVTGIVNEVSGTMRALSGTIFFQLNCGPDVANEVVNLGAITALTVTSIGNQVTGFAATELTIGSIEWTGDLAVDTNQNVTFLNPGTQDAITDNLTLETPGTITGIPSDAMLFAVDRSHCHLDRVFIQGDVTLNNTLALTGAAHVEIDGDLTVVGDANGYMSLANTSLLTVSGNLIFDGDVTNSLTNSGIIVVGGNMIVRKHAGTDAFVNNATGSITVRGDLTFEDNAGTTGYGAVDNGTIIVTGDIISCANYGDSGSLNNITAANTKGTLTITDTLTITGNVISGTGGGSALLPADNACLHASGTITDVPTVANFLQKANTGTNRVVFDAASINLNNRLVITGSSAVVAIGDLNITGSVDDYLDIASGSTLTVYGNILIDGMSQYNVNNQGSIITRGGTRSITVQNNESASTDAVATNIMTATGDILLQNNASASGSGVNNNGTMTSSGDIDFIVNCGSVAQVSNSGAINASGTIEEFQSTVVGGTTTPGVTTIAEGSVTLNSGVTVAVDASNNITFTGASVSLSTGTVYIVTPGIITNGPADPSIVLIENSSCVDHATIFGDLRYTGSLSVASSATLGVVGNLNVSGNTSNYINISSGGTVTAQGDITFDGAAAHNIVNAGSIITTTANKVVILQNNESTTTDGVVNNTITATGSISILNNKSTRGNGFNHTGTMTSSTGDLSFINNSGSINGVLNAPTGTMSATTGDIEFVVNCGTVNAVLNDGSITAPGGGAVIEEFESTIAGNATVPAVTTLTSGSLTLDSGTIIAVDASNNITFTSSTISSLTGKVYIVSPGSITDAPTDPNLVLIRNSDCVTRATVYGDLAYIGSLTVAGSGHLEVDGNLTVTGNSADYINLAASSTVTANGDIIFDGASTHNINNLGSIVTTTTNKSITLRNNASASGQAVVSDNMTATGAISVTGNSSSAADAVSNTGTLVAIGNVSFVDNVSTSGNGIHNTGTMTSSVGGVLFTNNSGTVNGVLNAGSGTITATVGDVEFIVNCGTTNAVLNSGSITAPGGGAVIEEFESTISGNATVPAASTLSSGSLTLSSGATVTIDTNQNMTLTGSVSSLTGGKVFIVTPGTITSSLSNANLVTVPNSHCVTRATVYGDLTYTGSATLTGNAHLEVDGNFSLTGNVENYFNMGTPGATSSNALTVNGNILFDGASSFGVFPIGDITTTSGGTLTAQNHASATGNGAAFGSSISTTSIDGDITIQNNSVTSAANGAGLFGTVRSVNGNILINNNTTTAAAAAGLLILNSPLVEAQNGTITITNNSGGYGVTHRGTAMQADGNITISNNSSSSASFAPVWLEGTTTSSNGNIAINDNFTTTMSNKSAVSVLAAVTATSTGATVTMHNNRGREAGVSIASSVTADSDISLSCNDSQTTSGVGIDVAGSVTSNNGDIHKYQNSGAIHAVDNAGTVTSTSGAVTFFSTGTLKNTGTISPAATVVNAGTLTLNSGAALTIDTDNNMAFTGASVSSLTDQILITSPGTITGAPSDPNIIVIENNGCVTRATIHGNLTYIGALTLTGSGHLEVDGNFNLTGNANNYITAASGSTITVENDAVFDGASIHSASFAGSVVSTSGSITIRNHESAATDAVVTNIITANQSVTIDANVSTSGSGIRNTGTMTATTGNVTFSSNNGSVNGVFNDDGTITATAQDVLFFINCGTTNDVLNSASGNITAGTAVRELGTTVTNSGTIMPAVTAVATGSLTLNSGATIAVDGSQNITFSRATISSLTGTVYVATPGTITGAPANANLILLPNNGCATRATIYGDLTYTGSATLTSTGHLEVDGNFSITGNADNYFNMGTLGVASSTALTVNGNLLFDGASTHSLDLVGSNITTADSGNLTIQNHSATGNTVSLGNNTGTKNITVAGTVTGQNNASTSTGNALLLFGDLQSVGNVLFDNNTTASVGATGFIAESGSSINVSAGTLTITNNDGTFGTFLRGVSAQASGDIIINDNEGSGQAAVTVQTPITSTTGSITINGNTSASNIAVNIQNNIIATSGGATVAIESNTGNIDGINISSAGTITADANISFGCNVGTTRDGVQNDGTITSNNGNIDFVLNTGASNGLNNTAAGTLDASGGPGPITHFSPSGLTNAGTANPAISSLTIGGITLDSGATLTVDTNNNMTFTGVTSPVVTDNIVIASPGTITGISAASNIILIPNSNCVSRATVYGDLTYTGSATFSGSAHLQVDGDFNLTGNASNYFNMGGATNAATSTALTVRDNIVFDGASTHPIALYGDVTTTNGSLTVQNHDGSFAFRSVGILNSSGSNSMSIHGDITIQNTSLNSGVGTRMYGGTITSTTGNILYDRAGPGVTNPANLYNAFQALSISSSVNINASAGSVTISNCSSISPIINQGTITAQVNVTFQNIAGAENSIRFFNDTITATTGNILIDNVTGTGRAGSPTASASTQPNILLQGNMTAGGTIILSNNVYSFTNQQDNIKANLNRRTVQAAGNIEFNNNSGVRRAEEIFGATMESTGGDIRFDGNAGGTDDTRFLSADLISQGGAGTICYVNQDAPVLINGSTANPAITTC